MTALDADAIQHYTDVSEKDRLAAGVGALELARTQEILERHLPPPPAVLLDVGGGPGRYAHWLSGLGYRVHLVDPVPKHVAQAREAGPLASATVGDARALAFEDGAADAALLLGPLYHLVERADRVRALAEARRAVKAGGVVVAAAISRFASTMDGLSRHLMDDPAFVAIARRDLADGQHRNPTSEPGYFTTAYFHRPEELAAELADAGLTHRETLAVEGPAWLLGTFTEHWADPARRERLMDALRRIEGEPSLLGASAHLLVVGRR